MSMTLRRLPTVLILVAALLGALLAVGIAAPARVAAAASAHEDAAVPATADAVASAAGPGRMLLAADAAAGVLYAYSLPGLELTGQLDDVVLGTHAGTVVLPDGRVLFVDDRHAEVLAVATDGEGRPQIVGRAAIPPLDGQPWRRAGWAAVDPGGRYYVVGSDYDGAARQTATVVDLTTYAVGQVAVDLNPTADGGYEEMHVYLAGSPLQVLVTAGGEFRSYRLADVLAGPGARPVSSAPVGPNTHGPVVAPDGERIYSTTTDGLDGVRVRRNALRRPVSIPYSPRVDVVQNFRPRLGYDGGTVVGAVAENEQLPAERWAETTNLFHTADLTAQRSRLTALADGILSRPALSRAHAAFALLSGDGDALLLVDADPASPTFGETVHDVALDPLAAGPVAGVSPAGTERRAAAITQEGDLAFVTGGGEGRIDVVTARRAAVTASITTPTPLTGGGYLVTVEPGAPLVDVVAR